MVITGSNVDLLDSRRASYVCRCRMVVVCQVACACIPGKYVAGPGSITWHGNLTEGSTLLEGCRRGCVIDVALPLIWWSFGCIVWSDKGWVVDESWNASVKRLGIPTYDFLLWVFTFLLTLIIVYCEEAGNVWQGLGPHSIEIKISQHAPQVVVIGEKVTCWRGWNVCVA